MYSLYRYQLYDKYSICVKVTQIVFNVCQTIPLSFCPVCTDLCVFILKCNNTEEGSCQVREVL
jgi:hypothetical protein